MLFLLFIMMKISKLKLICIQIYSIMFTLGVYKMNFIKTHKNALIVVLTCLVLMILALVAIYRMFYPNSSKSVYGDRTAGAPQIDSAIIEKIKNEITEKDITNSVSYRLDGVIMKFFIDTKKDTKVPDAQQLTDVILDNLALSITDFYDIQVYMTQTEKEDAVEFPMIGYHSKDAKEFTFVLNKKVDKAGDTDE